MSTLFPKYNAHRSDAGADDDTGLHVWILCFRIGGHGVIVWMVVLIARGSTTLFLYGSISFFFIGVLGITQLESSTSTGFPINDATTGNIKVSSWPRVSLSSCHPERIGRSCPKRGAGGHETDCTHLVPNRAHRASCQHD